MSAVVLPLHRFTYFNSFLPSCASVFTKQEPHILLNEVKVAVTNVIIIIFTEWNEKEIGEKYSILFYFVESEKGLRIKCNKRDKTPCFLFLTRECVWQQRQCMSFILMTTLFLSVLQKQCKINFVSEKNKKLYFYNRKI